MNERIKELAKQAQQYAEYTTPQGLEWFDGFKQKFAELIVKECISLTSECSGKVHPDDLNELFKEHFEIKV